MKTFASEAENKALKGMVMAQVTFDFYLRRIPDRCLNLLLRGAAEGSRRVLVRSVRELLLQLP
jgi:hypothetical protein